MRADPHNGRVTNPGDLITARGFARFYTPLAATSLLLPATNPILAAALARSADPVTALAGYSVAFAVCGVLCAPPFVMQQVAAARLLAGGLRRGDVGPPYATRPFPFRKSIMMYWPSVMVEVK